jgi:hypothetical protein
MKKYILLSLTIILLLLSCFNDDQQEIPFPDYTTPTRTFVTFMDCFNRYNQGGMIGYLTNSMDDEFIFYCDPDDPEILPDSIGREDFLTMAAGMFKSVTDISFSAIDIDNEGLGTPGEGDTEYSAEAEINFISMVEIDEGFLADGIFDMNFVKVGNEWKIVRIYDHTYGDGGVSLGGDTAIQSTSFGRILEIFS